MEVGSSRLIDFLEKIKADITAIQGVGFAVGERLRRRVLSLISVNEGLAIIRIKAKFFNISLMCAHAPTEEKDDVNKDHFYERVEDTYERCPYHDGKIVLGDFNARVCKEGIFGPTVGKFSLHDETFANGMRLIDFAGAQKIHQATAMIRMQQNSMQQNSRVHRKSKLNVEKLPSDRQPTNSQLDSHTCSLKAIFNETIFVSTGLTFLAL